MSEQAVSTGRLVSIDLARFVAIAAMFVAYAAPSDGPWGLLGLSDFLAAPLFALLIGVSTYLSAHRMALPILFASSVVRGLLLIALGEYLATWGAQGDIILQVLGLLCIVVVPLVMLPVWGLAIVALVSWFFTLQVQAYFLPLVDRALAKNEYFGLAVDWAFTGEHYRVFTMLCWATLGAMMIQAMKVWGVAGDVAAFLVSLTAAGALYWYVWPLGLLEFYSGSRWEIGIDALLCVAVLSFCSLLSRIFAARDKVLAPFALVGRMSLSLYVLQIGVLALYTKYAPSYGLPVVDDSWWMLALLFGLAFLFCLLWNKILGRTFLWRGPLESVLAWTTGRG